MDFIDKIKEVIAGENNKKILHTKYGDFNLAKQKDREAFKGIVTQIRLQTEGFTSADIGKWRQSWQLAVNIEEPNRKPLYDLYRDVEIDNHLSGAIGQRKGFIKSKNFNLIDTKGEIKEVALQIFIHPWFDKFINLALDSIYWGHSLIELGEIVETNKVLTFDDVFLIPRKHVIPEFGIFLINQDDDYKKGINYRDEQYYKSLIEVGGNKDLGLYLKAAKETIAKKNMLAFWDAFGEIFGMPMRIAKTISRNPSEIRDIEAMMKLMAQEAYAILPEGTEFQVVETSKGDAFNVYDKRIDRANSELSKLIIGQTMTIEDGSSLSQSQTHLEVFQNIIRSDAKMLSNIINHQLIPKMIQLGFKDLEGVRFEWSETYDYTPEEQMRYESMIADRYEVDPAYFANKYNMPVGQRIDKFSLVKANKEPFFD